MSRKCTSKISRSPEARSQDQKTKTVEFWKDRSTSLNQLNISLQNQIDKYRIELDAAKRDVEYWTRIVENLTGTRKTPDNDEPKQKLQEQEITSPSVEPGSIEEFTPHISESWEGQFKHSDSEVSRAIDLLIIDTGAIPPKDPGMAA